MKPKVSIITPCFNRLEYTIRCFDSVRRTNHGFNYEHIFIDNASWDGTQQWFKSIADLDTDWWGKIVYVRLNENIGLHKARAKGITFAEGDYIFMLDNDTSLVNFESDLSELCTLYDYLAEYENCGVLQGKRHGVRIVIELQNPHKVLENFTVGEVWYSPMPFFRRDIVPEVVRGFPDRLPKGRRVHKVLEWPIIHMDMGTMKEKGFNWGDQMHKYPNYFKTKVTEGEDSVSKWMEEGEE